MSILLLLRSAPAPHRQTWLQAVDQLATDSHRGPSGMGVEVQRMHEEDEADEEISLDRLKEMVDESAVIRVVNLIISQAINDHASSIHLEPEAHRLTVRYRVDGVLYEVMNPPKHIHAAMTERIKIMSYMDITESRVPQDGLIHLTHDGRQFRLLVSVIPCVYGEKVVLRVRSEVEEPTLRQHLEKLELSALNLAQVRTLLQRPSGLFLVSGPSRAGKTSSLYSCLRWLDNGQRNISTVEYEIKARLPGISQMQTNPKIGLHFSTGLRALLRQDPDVIMVGSIHDGETARLAVDAALDRHLVLGATYNQDAAETIRRLLHTGVEPYLVASALNGVLAQRLVRRICSECKTGFQSPPEVGEILKLTQPPSRLYAGAGCQTCHSTGYRGQCGIHEVLLVDEGMRGLILRNASCDEIRQHAGQAGMVRLRDDCRDKTVMGLTSLEEFIRLTRWLE